MTFSKLNLSAAGLGALAGIALFALVYAFRDAFAAVESLQDCMSTASGRAGGVVTVPALAVGVGLVWLVQRASDVWGAILLLPLVVFVGAATGVALFLESQIIREGLASMTEAIVFAGLFVLVTATVRGWMIEGAAGP